MKLLILGVLLWSLVHLAPAVLIGVRTTLVDRLGEAPYKGLAGILILGSIVLMILGWKSLPQEFIYESPVWADYVCGLAMLAMSILFFAPYMPNNISRFMRLFYGILKAVTFGYVFLIQPWPDLFPVFYSGSRTLLIVIKWILVYATVAVCLIRGMPVIFEFTTREDGLFSTLRR